MGENSCKNYFDGASADGSSPRTCATEVRVMRSFALLVLSIRRVTSLVSLLTLVTTPMMPLVVRTRSFFLIAASIAAWRARSRFVGKYMKKYIKAPAMTSIWIMKPKPPPGGAPAGAALPASPSANKIATVLSIVFTAKSSCINGPSTDVDFDRAVGGRPQRKRAACNKANSRGQPAQPGHCDMFVALNLNLLAHKLQGERFGGQQPVYPIREASHPVGWAEWAPSAAWSTSPTMT